MKKDLVTIKKHYKVNQEAAVKPYEEYYNGGLSVICPHCGTQLAIPECDSVRVMQCPECLEDIYITWTGEETGKCDSAK